MYDPSIGRFISEDPIQIEAGDTNYYRYVGNSPTNYIDPTGFYKSDVHKRVTEKGLKDSGLSVGAINIITTMNVNQDSGATYNGGPFADPLNHGDNNKIKETIERMNEYLDAARSSSKPEEVFKEFGKAMHAMQDLYSHSTYIEWQDKRADGKSKKGTIPTWKMYDEDGTPLIPKGVITGEYEWPWDNAKSPSHAELNKDDSGSKRGKQKNQEGVTYFELAEDVSTRATKKAWDELFKKLSLEMQEEVLNYGQKSKK